MSHSLFEFLRVYTHLNLSFFKIFLFYNKLLFLEFSLRLLLILFWIKLELFIDSIVVFSDRVSIGATFMSVASLVNWRRSWDYSYNSGSLWWYVIIVSIWRIRFHPCCSWDIADPIIVDSRIRRIVMTYGRCLFLAEVVDIAHIWYFHMR